MKYNTKTHTVPSFLSEELKRVVMGSILLFFIAFSISAIEPFRFALLTDLHITEKTSSIADLENSVKQLNTTPNIDFVLVTGDITEYGDRASLKKAKALLDNLSMPYYIIPGNHETKWSQSGCTDFQIVFGCERFAFEHKGIHFLGFNTGPILRMGDGHVAQQDITWLKTELSKKAKSEPVILATHYPLQYGDVDNWYELTDAVRSYNIRAIVGGHYHRNVLLTYDGIPGVINRSNLRAKAEVGGYSIYDVTPDSLIVYEHLIGSEPKQWAAFSMTETYFKEKGSNTKYPDFSVNKQFPQVKEKWFVTTGVGIYSSPVVWRNRVFVGDEMGYLTCYDLKKGKQRWRFQTGNRIIGTPAVANGIVVFGSTDKNIYGLSAYDGRLLWKTRADEAVLGAVSIDAGIAYIGASDYTFRAIDIQTGKENWTFKQLGGYVETKPLITGNRVIFGAWDTYLYALDKHTGELQWKWTNGKKSSHYSPAAVWPTTSDGKVFVVDPERAMTAIDITTGATVWRTKQSMVRESIGLSEDGKRVYAKTMQDSVVCYAATGDTPRRLWVTNVGYGYEHNPSMLIEKDGKVYGSTKNGMVFVLDALTGTVIWKHKIDNSLINTVSPIDGKQVLITSTNGKVALLKYRP